MNFYTSDLHFGASSLLSTGRYKERPFKTLEEMDNAIIYRWNRKVTNGDDVYILGDIGGRGYKNMHPDKLVKLKGKKHLILGNHDDVSDLRIRQQFVEIIPYKEISDNVKKRNYKLVLCHYPIMMWNGQRKDSILLYGHVHNTKDEELFQQYLKEYNEARPPEGKYHECKAYNVGSCKWGYEPVTLEEIFEKATKKES